MHPNLGNFSYSERFFSIGNLLALMYTDIEYTLCRDSKLHSCITKQSYSPKGQGIWWSGDFAFPSAWKGPTKSDSNSSSLLTLGIGYSFAVVIQTMDFWTPTSLHHPFPFHSSSAISEFEKRTAVPMCIIYLTGTVLVTGIEW